MAEDDLECLFAPYVRKSHCWTEQHRYPRTLHNTDYLDWTSDPLRPGRNLYLTPVRSTQYPIPLHKRFRPLPPMDPEVEEKLRLTMFNPKGRKTPVEALHYGYRKFTLDPSAKTLRHFDDPIPHPLHTVVRVSYQDPALFPQLQPPQNYQRYGWTPRDVASGIAPLVMCEPPPWSEDCLFEQEQQRRQQQQQQQQQQQ